MVVRRLLGPNILFPSYEFEKEYEGRASVAKKEEDCQQTGGLLGGERDRLKRVSNHDIPVLTPQLFKRKNSPVASEMHHHLAVSREMLRL